MGKAQKKKATRRHNPVRVPDSHLPHGLASASSTSSKAEAILPIIQKMGSVEASERIWACAAVSNLIQNDPSTRRLLQGKNIVHELISRLSDSVEAVIVEAAGALRNLSIDGGYDICAEMYNKNILAHLRNFPAKISTTLQQFLNDPKGAPEGSRRLVYEFAENVITIFWCLSETSNKALKAINDINLVPFLVAFIQAHEQLPLTTVIAAAQCLYVLTEENDTAIDSLRSEPSYITVLLKIARSDVTTVPTEEGNKITRSITLRVLVTGILRNVSPLPVPIPAPPIDLENTIVLPLLVPQLSVNLEEIADNVTQLLVLLSEQEMITKKPSLEYALRSDHRSTPEKELNAIEEQLRVVQLCLEILTGVCAKLPEPIAVSADLQDDDDDEMEMDTEPEDVQGLLMSNGTEEPNNPERKSTNSLLSMLTGPLVTLVHPTALSFPPGPSEPSSHPPSTSALSTIHIRALECLNNLFLAIEDNGDSLFSINDREGAETMWNQLWLALAKVGKVVDNGKIIASRGLEKKAEMWEIAMGVLWGIARVGRGYLAPDPEQVQALIELCNATADDMTKVKCIGALECLAQNGEAIDANKAISTYLLSQIVSPSPSNAESCLQSISALIDIYSDETVAYDVNFREGRWVDTLAAALPAIRKLVRSIDRRKPGGMELRARGDEVVLNLAAFIKYRQALRI